MGEFNVMPKNAKIINEYKEFQDFFVFKEELEFRQIQYNSKTIMEGSFNLKIFWINKEKGLGFGIADDWKSKQIVFYKFGAEELWSAFKTEFASKQY